MQYTVTPAHALPHSRPRKLTNMQYIPWQHRKCTISSVYTYIPLQYQFISPLYPPLHYRKLVNIPLQYPPLTRTEFVRVGTQAGIEGIGIMITRMVAPPPPGLEPPPGMNPMGIASPPPHLPPPEVRSPSFPLILHNSRRHPPHLHWMFTECSLNVH
jgi:hypothetical protein